ncbi:NAD-dependent epimerase/dehydratase family protein [Massilia sp. METH4]|uniref:NAD-dependent epimerase/dehydratase family protein n=1 Tax=Massilia sp. METH4 TaxID=3123041 RepID=UPI0030CC5599
MNILVTGSSGHLGEALVRVLRDIGHHAVGIDVLASPFTDVVASNTDGGALREAMRGIDATHLRPPCLVYDGTTVLLRQ